LDFGEWVQYMQNNIIKIIVFLLVMHVMECLQLVDLEWIQEFKML